MEDGQQAPMPDHIANDPAQAEAWQQDRVTEARPLPYAEVKRYPHDVAKNVSLAAAERSNIARAAGELGVTSDQWAAKKKELGGRSPNASDFR